jgi:serine/threonine-protein kinase RsbW
MTDTVTLTFGADTRNVALARSVAASMSARADLPVDQLEDVRLAVDEAVSQLILDAPDGGAITCAFRLVPGGLNITLSAPSASGRTPARDTFSWTVLAALVDKVAARVSQGIVTLEIHVVRAVAVDA